MRPLIEEENPEEQGTVLSVLGLGETHRYTEDAKWLVPIENKENGDVE